MRDICMPVGEMSVGEMSVGYSIHARKGGCISWFSFDQSSTLL
jgi:hypothetical protein